MTETELADAWHDAMHNPPNEEEHVPEVYEAPGLAGPWPNPRRYPVTRRLLAMWRWEYERGETSEAAHNARRSLLNRVAGLGVDVLC